MVLIILGLDHTNIRPWDQADGREPRVTNWESKANSNRDSNTTRVC